MACVFCESTKQLGRMSDLDVCDGCRMGDVEGRLPKWGLESTFKMGQSASGSGENSRTVFYLDMTLTLTAAPAAAAHFRTENTFDRAVQWVLRNEPQAGDPLFDRAVYIEQSSGREFDRVLQDSGVQSAILEVLADGSFRLEQGRIRARRTDSDTFPSDHDLRLRLSLLGIHLHRLATQTA